MDMTWPFFASLSVLFSGAAGVAIYVRRLRAELERQEGLVRGLERDMQAVCVGARGMGEAVVLLEDRLRRLTERQDELALREPDEGVYHQAIRLASRGASVEELVTTCGLPRGEAELVQILHRSAQSRPHEAPRPAATGTG